MIRVSIELKRKNFNLKVDERFDTGITGVFGPSGSGKTSLMHAIAGLAVPEKGRISIGTEIVFASRAKYSLPVHKRNIGYVFQEGRLFPHMTIKKNLLYGIKDGKNTLSFGEVLDMLNLRHILNSKPSAVSGGERQRTALGRTLMSSPDILLLDEPFSAVDTRLRNQIIPYLIHIHEKIKIPILVVSHELPDLLKLTSKICVINNGECLGHDHYFKLLKTNACAEILGSKSFVNAINLEVEEVDPDTGLTILWTGHNGNRLRVVCEKSKEPYQVKQRLNVFINADDIALSAEKVEGLTIQNQLKGTIVDVVNIGSNMLCMVDVGFPLSVEITAESLKRLNIVVGQQVYCLFKSVAIDVAV